MDLDIAAGEIEGCYLVISHRQAQGGYKSVDRAGRLNYNQSFACLCSAKAAVS